MKKKLSKIQSSSVDSRRGDQFKKSFQDIAQNDTLPEFTIEVEGPPRIQPRGPAEIKTNPYEGNYPTMSGANLASAGYKGLSGSTDYYYRGSKDNPMVIGEVDIEGGKVTGVYGDDPSFYGPKNKHQRKKK